MPSQAAKALGVRPRPVQVSPVCGSQYLGATVVPRVLEPADFLTRGSLAPVRAAISAFCLALKWLP